MKNIKSIVLILVTFCIMTKAYSQGELSVQAGPAFPLLEFAADDFLERKDGGAAPGINIGIKYVYKPCTCGIEIFGGVDLNYNGLQKDFKDDTEFYYSQFFLSDITYSRYINIPLSAGIQYSYDLNAKFGVFANVGVTFNFLKITDEKIQFVASYYSTEMKTASCIGHKLGVGFIVNEKIILSFDYFGLGDHTISGVQNSSSGPFGPLKYERELKVDLLTLTLGYRF